MTATVQRPAIRVAVLSLAPLIQLAGCSAVAELAYDEAAAHERANCERLVTMSDRQACLQRINTAAKQAGAAREKQSR